MQVVAMAVGRTRHRWPRPHDPRESLSGDSPRIENSGCSSRWCVSEASRRHSHWLRGTMSGSTWRCLQLAVCTGSHTIVSDLSLESTCRCQSQPMQPARDASRRSFRRWESCRCCYCRCRARGLVLAYSAAMCSLRKPKGLTEILHARQRSILLMSAGLSLPVAQVPNSHHCECVYHETMIEVLECHHEGLIASTCENHLPHTPHVLSCVGKTVVRR